MSCSFFDRLCGAVVEKVHGGQTSLKPLTTLHRYTAALLHCCTTTPLHCYTANIGNNANVANRQQRHHHPILFFCQLYNLNFKFQYCIVNIRLPGDWCAKVWATEEGECKGRVSSVLLNSFTTICLLFGDYPKGLCSTNSLQGITRKYKVQVIICNARDYILEGSLNLPFFHSAQPYMVAETSITIQKKKLVT